MRRATKLRNGLLNKATRNERCYRLNSYTKIYSVNRCYSIQPSNDVNNTVQLDKNVDGDQIRRKITKLLYSSILRSARIWEQLVLNNESRLDHQFEVNRLISKLPFMLQAESKDIMNNNTQNLSVVTAEDLKVLPVIVQLRSDIQEEIKASTDDDTKEKAHQRTVNDMFGALKVFNDRTAALKKILINEPSVTNENSGVKVSATVKYVTQVDSSVVGDIRYTFLYTINVQNTTDKNFILLRGDCGVVDEEGKVKQVRAEPWKNQTLVAGGSLQFQNQTNIYSRYGSISGSFFFADKDRLSEAVQLAKNNSNNVENVSDEPLQQKSKEPLSFDIKIGPIGFWAKKEAKKPTAK